MGDEGDGEQPLCPNCGEEVEESWVKCPMCNTPIRDGKGDAPSIGPESEGAPVTVPAKPVPGPPPSPPTKPKEMGDVPPDMAKADEARKISESAAARSKAEAELKEAQGQLAEKDEIITELQETIESLRSELDTLEKKEEELSKREVAAGERLKEVERREQQAQKIDAELKRFELEKNTLEAERAKVKGQATSLTEMEKKLAEQKKKLEQWEGHIMAKESGLDGSKTELDTMIEQYGEKLTSLKMREEKAKAEELRVQELGAKLEIERRDLADLRERIEKEKAETTERSQKLFDKIRRAEGRTEELDKRERNIEASERKAAKWEEDLRHIEIHLLSIQEEIDNCVYCSVKDRFMTVDKLLAEAKAVGADVDVAEDEVKRAKILLDEGEFEKAVERAKSAIRMAEQAKKQYYSYGVKYTIKAVEKIILSIRELGVSTQEPENILKEAKDALADEDYERAEDYAKMAERIVLHMEEKAEDISAMVRRIEGMLGVARNEGRDVRLADELFTEAKEQAKRGEYGSSLETLREAEEALIEQQVSSVQAGLSEDHEPMPGPPQEEPVPEEPEAADTGYQQEADGAGTGGYDYYQQPEVPVETQAPVQYAPPQPQAPTSTRFRCPYCSNIFEVRAETRPVTATCPYCSQKVLIN